MAKRLVASILTAIMVFSLLATPVMAGNVTGGVLISPATERGYFGIDGVGTIENPVLSVIVPVNLNFVLDPFGTTGTHVYTSGTTQTSQVVEEPFQVINRTADVPVATVFFLEVETAGDVTLTGGDVAARNSMNNTSKKIQFGVVSANTITFAATYGDTTLGDTMLGGASATDGTTTTRIAFDATATNVLVTFGETSKQADFGFVLDAVTDGDSTANKMRNVSAAAFMFYAQMTAFADWQDGDVNVSGVLWLTPVPTPMLNTSADGGTGEFLPAKLAGHRMINPVQNTTDFPTNRPVLIPPALGFYGSATGFSRTSLTAATFNFNGHNETTLFIPFVGLTATGNNVVVNRSSGVIATSDYTLSATGITFGATRTNTLKTGTLPTSYTIVVTPSSGPAVTHTITFVNTP